MQCDISSGYVLAYAYHPKGWFEQRTDAREAVAPPAQAEGALSDSLQPRA